MKYKLAILVVALSAMVATVAACGGTETVVETVVVERVITQAPERVVETVEVERVVEREVVQTVEVEREVVVEVEKQVVQTVEVEREVVVEVEKQVVQTVEVERVVEVEKVVEVERVVEVEVTVAAMDDSMMMGDEIPRNRQLILLWGGAGGVGSAGRYTDHDIWSPYNPGTSHQNGTGILHEPLAFYSAFNDQEYPWLAESWDYSADFTQLTINLREGITWSDGEPFGAHDVAYTLKLPEGQLRSSPQFPGPARHRVHRGSRLSHRGR